MISLLLPEVKGGFSFFQKSGKMKESDRWRGK